MRVVAVSELTGYLKSLMEEDYYLQDAWVRGEITNYTQSSAGHRYFSLKDESAVLRCVLFGRRGGYVPPMRNGMAVLVHGRMSLYEARGDCQFYVESVEEAGIGILHLRFEELKARLEAEGLFDQGRKRPLPASPATIGVVTSASAAALRDIVRTLRLRCPLVRVLLAPTLVQGEGAAEQIAAALDALSAQGDAEVIVVARGGGSLEELWAFNEEIVARAIARARVPVVSGVGHETDFTIADFVADLRASTPTAAAMAAVPDASVWRAALAESRLQLASALADGLTERAERLSTSEHRLHRAAPLQRIAEARQRVDTASDSLALRLRHLLEVRRERLGSRAMQLHTLSPLLTLGRGYAIIRSEPEGAIITRVGQVAPGQRLSVRLRDGAFAATAGERLPDAPQAVQSGQVVPGAPVDGTRPAGARRGRAAEAAPRPAPQHEGEGSDGE